MVIDDIWYGPGDHVLDCELLCEDYEDNHSMR